MMEYRAAWCSGVLQPPALLSTSSKVRPASPPCQWPQPWRPHRAQVLGEKARQPVLGPVLPPPSHKTGPNRGLSSFILQSGLSRDEHRLLERLEGSPCVSQGEKPRLRQGPGWPSCADRSEAAPRVTCCPGRGSLDSGSLQLSLDFPHGCSSLAV